MAAEGVLVAVNEFDAVDVKAIGRERGVGGLIRAGFGSLGFASEGLPTFSELEVVVIAALVINFADVARLEVHLSIEESCFEADKAGLTPTDGGEMVDEVFFHVVAGGEGGADASDVGVERGFVFDAEDDIDGGGEAVFESILAGFGLACDGNRAVRFGAVDARLFR